MTRPLSSQLDRKKSRPGFLLDLGRCVGCGACVLACRIENGLPLGVSWRRVLQVNEPRIGGGPTYHLSVACHHCENPPCAKACPSGALAKQENGIVLLDPDRCLGCRYCEMACPFDAPSFDAESGIMTKCHLCSHRLALGEAPACVEACPTKALDFSYPGDGRNSQGDKDSPGARDSHSGRDSQADRDSKAGQDSHSGRDSQAGPAAEVGRFIPAVESPGFQDPSRAEPGFWVAPPLGGLRAGWYARLSKLMGVGGGGADEEI